MDQEVLFVPKHKDDFQAVEFLRKTDFERFKAHVNELLSWIQDMNWPVAKEIAEILSSYTNNIKKQIIYIIRGDDDIWKYWCIRELLYFTKEKELDCEIISELKRIVSDPTKGEVEEEVNLIAKETLEKYQSDSL